MAKNFTWDTKAVIKAAGRVKAEALRMTAKDIRSTAKRSMKDRKDFRDSAAPGAAPNAHLGILKKSIYFAWDENRQSAVVGPVKYEGRSDGAIALEEGGRRRITTKVPVETKTVKQRQSRISYYKNGFENKDGTGRRYRPMSERSAKEQAAIKDYYDNRRQVVKTVTKTVNMPARPFMNPAMKKELRKMSDRLKRAAKKFRK